MNTAIEELWRLLSGLVVAILLGLVTSQIALCVIGFLLVFSLWMVHRMFTLHQWLAQGARTDLTPDAVGLAGKIVQLMHRDKRNGERHRQRLRETLAQFRTLAAELPDATVVTDDRLQIQWCNKSAHSLLGVSSQRDAGQRIDNLLRQPEFHAFLQSGQVGTELEMASPMNEEVMLLLTMVPTTDRMRIISARNVTQRVKVREMRKAFVANVSHELKTPLTVINGFTEMLLDDPELDQNHREALGKMQGQSERMDFLIEDLLTLSKLESSRLGDSQGSHIHVSDLVQAMVENFRQTSGKAHNFDVRLDDDLGLLGIETEIYAACQNLISNAIAYTDPGTLIEIRWYRSETGSDMPSGAHFEVNDHGAGIEPEHLPRLSERFYRVDAGRARRHGGTGLGLAIVKHVAQRHGGTLIVDSEPGAGASFIVNLPAARVMDLSHAATLADDPNPDGIGHAASEANSERADWQDRAGFSPETHTHAIAATDASPSDSPLAGLLPDDSSRNPERQDNNGSTRPPRAAGE